MAVLYRRPLVLVARAEVVVLVLVLGLGLHRLFITNINWDEFFFLSKVHQFLNGSLTLKLQTFHVHLFAWLPSVSGDEIQQIMAARAVLWVLSLGTAWFIYAVARIYFSQVAALMSVLLYLCFSYVMDHGQSFRADPLCAFLFVAGLWLLLDDTAALYRIAVAGILMAVAMMISIKTVFYLSTLGLVLLAPILFGPDRSAGMKRALVFVLSFSAALAVLYFIHERAVGTEAGMAVSAYVEGAAKKTVFQNELFPRYAYIKRSVMGNTLIWALISLGAGLTASRLFRGRERKRNFVLLSFLVPLVSLAFYRNAFPYFFVFLMPAVVIVGGAFIEHLVAKTREGKGGIAVLALYVMLLFLVTAFATNYVKRLPDQTVAQRETVELIHEIFPEPVPYIDRNSMIASYPKVGFLMSTWGMEGYRKTGRRIMYDLVKRREPKFVIANYFALDISRSQTLKENASKYGLFEEDFDVLRDNYVHHWGKIFVAGKSFDLSARAGGVAFEILVSGEYTLESQAPVLLDGTIIDPGDHIRLSQGEHRIAAAGAATRAVLRWGQNLYKPNRAPSSQRIYYGF